MNATAAAEVLHLLIQGLALLAQSARAVSEMTVAVSAILKAQEEGRDLTAEEFESYRTRLKAALELWKEA